MTKYLILSADYPCGRGTRGLNLYRFLRIYHGGRAVRIISTDELLRGDRLDAEVVFIGMPTRLSREHLAKLRFGRAVLFDYHDGPRPAWLESDEELLRSLTDLYLRPWVEDSWDFGLRMGVLPIRRHFKLTACVRWRSAVRAMGLESRRRIHDVAFVGEATANQSDYHQRVEWLREIKRAGDRYSFWGGIAARKSAGDSLRARFPDFDDFAYPGGRVGFLTYFSHLCRSRAALAPAGNARWSYRHYEAIYAGAILVSADFRHSRTLIPLPCEHMIHVPDGDSVLPAIDQALALRANSPDLPQENIEFLERYLRDGDYCRKKPMLMDAFLEQLSR